MLVRNWRYCCVPVALLMICSECAAAEDIEFVTEHLPEAAMDNRYATLPIWTLRDDSSDGETREVQAAYSQAEIGGLKISGPLFSIALTRNLRGSWQLGVVAFYDPLTLKASRDDRPLQTLFSPTTPIERPVAARFTNLDGRAIDYGAGMFVTHAGETHWLGKHVWTAGLLWQRVELRDYRLDYEITEGPQSAVTGQIDFDADYAHIAPFVGAQLPRSFGQWSMSPHALLVVPLPRRGIVGHITGPDFDLRGDTAKVGQGKHFGDPSVTIGLNLRYEPARVSVDVGALVTQALLEPRIHRGIEANYLLSFCWQY
jgi:hypothetical protein